MVEEIIFGALVFVPIIGIYKFLELKEQGGRQ
jgi:hypothetical protein